MGHLSEKTVITLRACYRCNDDLTENSRADAIYCSRKCKDASGMAARRLVSRLQVEFADWTYDDALSQGIISHDDSLRFHGLRPVLEVEFPGALDKDIALIDGIRWDDDGSVISQRILKGDADIEGAVFSGDWSAMYVEADSMMLEASGYITRGLQGHSQDDRLVDNDPLQT